MYKIVDLSKTSFVLEIKGRTFKFSAVPSLEKTSVGKLTDEMFELSLLVKDKMERINRNFDARNFREIIYRKVAKCMHNSLIENNFFNGTPETIFFEVKLNKKIYKMNACPSLYSLKDTCTASTCSDCRLRAFKLIANVDDVKDKFKNQDKKVIVIDDYICGSEKQRLIDKFKIEENIKNKMCSFIDNDEIKILCPRYLYLKDKGCYQTGGNENKCIECWKEARRDYEEGEE